MIVERSRAFGRKLCEGIITYAQDRDDWYLQFLTPSDLRRRQIRDNLDGFIARVTSNAFARLLKSTGMPVVDIYYENPLPGFAVVKTKHEAVGILAAEHFIDRRFKNFAYCPYGGGRTSAYCRKSFIRRLRRAGFGCNVYSTKNEPSYCIDGSDHISDVLSPPKDAKQLEKWLASLPKPVAIFCPSDLRAWQINEICHSSGINVPREVAILGLDNDIIICGTSKPMISSIDPDAQKIGYTAAETLTEMMENGIPERMIIRQIPPSGVVTRASSETAPVEPAWLADALVYIQRNAKHGSPSLPTRPTTLPVKTSRSSAPVNRLSSDIMLMMFSTVLNCPCATQHTPPASVLKRAATAVRPAVFSAYTSSTKLNRSSSANRKIP